MRESVDVCIACARAFDSSQHIYLCAGIPEKPVAPVAPVPPPVDSSGAASSTAPIPPESLDDLLRTLVRQINSSDWIQTQVPTGERLWGPEDEEGGSSASK